MAGLFENVNGIWKAVGAALALVALYLLLTNAGGAKDVLGALFNGSSGVFKTLQGR